MLLSRQQKYILEALRRLGCVRMKQLTALLQARFFPPDKPVPEGFTQRLVRQLITFGESVRTEGELLLLPGRNPDEKCLEAVDVMLELSQCDLIEFWTEDGAVLLRFAVSGKRVSLFAVLHGDTLMGADVRAPPVFSPTERIVILLPDNGSAPRLSTTNKTFYALRQADGTHRFFTGQEE